MRSFVRRFREHAKRRKARRELQKKLNYIFDVFEADLATADTWEKQQSIEQQREYECSEFADEINRIDSLALLDRGRRCHVLLLDILPPVDAPNHWIQGEHGTWHLHPKSFHELSKAVEEAENQRVKRVIDRGDFAIKAYTALVATIAAIGTIVTLIRC
jgi:hypothetical protein